LAEKYLGAPPVFVY